MSVVLTPTDNYADRQTDRQIDRQTDRQTDRETERPLRTLPVLSSDDHLDVYHEPDAENDRDDAGDDYVVDVELLPRHPPHEDAGEYEEEEDSERHRCQNPRTDREVGAARRRGERCQRQHDPRRDGKGDDDDEDVIKGGDAADESAS